MLAELHAHSHYSHGKKVVIEGLDSPQEMVKTAANKGLDVIAITDHNTIKGGLEAQKYEKKYDVIVIPGEEVSTSDGHILALGIQENINKGLPVKETVDLITDQDGIAIAAHPFDVRNYGVKEKSLLCDGIEVFNGLGLDRIANRKANSFQKKYNLPNITGSDAHSKQMIGTCKTETNASDRETFLKNIKKGQTIIHTNYIPINIIQDWVIKRFKRSYNYTSDYAQKHYIYPKRLVAQKLLHLVNKSPGSIDHLFNMLSYAGLSISILYSLVKEITGV